MGSERVRWLGSECFRWLGGESAVWTLVFFLQASLIILIPPKMQTTSLFPFLMNSSTYKQNPMIIII